MSEARAPTDSKVKEEILKKYRKGTGPKALSEEYNISINTIKAWIKRSKEGAPSKAKKGTPSKTKKGAPAKKKAGAPIGNKNAVGNNGGPPVGSSNARKHGAYTDPHKRVMDPEELEALKEVEEDPEILMLQQIQYYTIRELRITKAINKYRLSDSPTALFEESRQEDKRSFRDEEEALEYETRRLEKIASGERMPGTPYTVRTLVENKDNIIARLERELTSVMRAKDQCIKSLLDIQQKKSQMAYDNDLRPLQKELLDARIENMDASTQRLLGSNIEVEDTTAADDLLYGDQTGGDDGETKS